jgi:hypothetical protein
MSEIATDNLRFMPQLNSMKSCAKSMEIRYKRMHNRPMGMDNRTMATDNLRFMPPLY